MEAYQQRVVEEKQALDIKIGALVPFLGGGKFYALPLDEQARLTNQLHVMQRYSAILGERIAAF